MVDAFRFDVFLSHASADKAAARELAERLRLDGLRVWFDEWEVQPGELISLAIERGLESSRTLVLVMSKASLASDWVALERHTAIFRDPTNKEKRFIPLRLDDVEPSSTLKQFAYIDWRTQDEAEYARLLAACKPGAAAEANFGRLNEKRAIQAGEAFKRLVDGDPGLRGELERIRPQLERVAADAGKQHADYKEYFERAFREPFPVSIEDWTRLATRAGLDPNWLLAGEWTARDVTPYIEGYLQRLKDPKQTSEPTTSLEKDTGAGGVQINRKTVLILLHGINDFGGTWMVPLQERIQEAGADVILLQEDRVTHVDLSMPRTQRQSHEASVRTKLSRTIIDQSQSGKEVVVVAHSYGAYLVAETLKENPQLRLARAVFIGGIISKDFDWNAIAPCFGVKTAGEKIPVLNVCGSRDQWPIYADHIDKDYGATGSRGMGHPVHDLFADGDHGTFLSPNYAAQTWLGFAVSGTKPPRNTAAPLERIDVERRARWVGRATSAVRWPVVIARSWKLWAVLVIVALLAVLFFRLKAEEQEEWYAGNLSAFARHYESIKSDENAVRIFYRETDGKRIRGAATIERVGRLNVYIINPKGLSVSIIAEFLDSHWLESLRPGAEIELEGTISSRDDAAGRFPLALRDCELQNVDSQAP